MSAAYDAFVDWYGQDVGGPTSYTFKESFEAGYRRALEDAADAVKDVRENGLPDGVMSAPYSEHFELWLRARAAAVAPDPRETKD